MSWRLVALRVEPRPFEKNKIFHPSSQAPGPAPGPRPWAILRRHCQRTNGNCRPPTGGLPAKPPYSLRTPPYASVHVRMPSVRVRTRPYTLREASGGLRRLPEGPGRARRRRGRRGRRRTFPELLRIASPGSPGPRGASGGLWGGPGGPWGAPGGRWGPWGPRGPWALFPPIFPSVIPPQ